MSMLRVQSLAMMSLLSVTDGLEQWMSGMREMLDRQDLIAARVKLVEGQIEGFKVNIFGKRELVF